MESKRGDCPQVKLGSHILPKCATVKYLGIHLDQRMTWKNHIQVKRDQLNIRFRTPIITITYSCCLAAI